MRPWTEGTNWNNSTVLGFLNTSFLSYFRNIRWLSAQGGENEIPIVSQVPVLPHGRGEGISRHLPGEWAGETDSLVTGLQVLSHQTYPSVLKQGIAVRKFIR